MVQSERTPAAAYRALVQRRTWQHEGALTSGCSSGTSVGSISGMYMACSAGHRSPDASAGSGN
eukprot:7912976-Alexandrium_andersonii.AAC.1